MTDDSYPAHWAPREMRQSTPAPAEAIALAIDAYIASLSESEFNQLVQRTRG